MQEHHSTGSSSITVSCHCTVQALRLLNSKQSRAFTTRGSSPRFACSLSVIYRTYGAKRKPFGLLFQCPHPPTHAGPVACRPSPLAAVAGLRFPAFGRPRLMPLPSSLRSLTPVVGGIPPRGSLDAPRRVSSLAYASGIPPALHWVIFVFLSCVLLFLSVRNS